MAKSAAIKAMMASIDRSQDLPYAVLHQDDDIHVGFYIPSDPDPQQPHEQDEYYFVASGTGEIVVEGELTSLAAGDAVFVPALAAHHFQNHTEDFAAWVLFWGPSRKSEC